jgi:hypothetical protein
MHAWLPTRILASTASEPVLAFLCLKSAPHRLGHTRRPYIQPATASWDRPHPTQHRLDPCPTHCLSSRLAVFNPHTSTELAPYCKSSYPHRSASAVTLSAESPRAEHCRYGTREIYRSLRTETVQTMHCDGEVDFRGPISHRRDGSASKAIPLGIALSARSR